MAGNRKKYKFTDKEQAAGGMASIILAILAILMFVLAVLIAYETGGAGGIIIGLFGVFSIWFSGMGIYLGIRSFKQEESFYLLSWIGTIANAVVLVGMGCIFLIGL